jgi:hypothetical protein
MIMARLILLFTIFIFLFPTAAYSDEVFRCGSDIVKVGDSSVTVKKVCGKPMKTEAAKSKTSKKKSKKSRIKTEDSSETSGGKSQKWYYDRGYGDFIYILTFKGNTLNNIQTAERGGK